MKFGDKVKVSDRLWKNLISIINPVHHPKMENYFTYIVSNNNIGIIASMDALTSLLRSTSSDILFGTNWEKYIFWKDYEDVRYSGRILMDYFNNHPTSKTGKFELIPPGYRDIIQNPTLTFDNIPTTEIFPFVDESIKLIHLSGGKCLICKDYNPYMEKDGFCWSCNSDPRNKYKIEEILVKMASV